MKKRKQGKTRKRLKGKKKGMKIVMEKVANKESYFACCRES